jgi:hypothetical protein
MMKRLIVLPFTGMLLLAAVIALLLAGNLYTYYRLSDEAPIAQLRFDAVGPQEYRAAVSWGDFCNSEYFTLYGDQWRLDARFLKWHSWANLIGLDAMYRLERLGGRYADVAAENSRRMVAYTLGADHGVDLVAMLDKYDGFLSPVDTLYGSSVYEEMSPGYLYRVFRSQSGLLVRKQKLVPPEAGGGPITIEINSGCTARRGLFEQVLTAAGKLFRAEGC